MNNSAGQTGPCSEPQFPTSPAWAATRPAPHLHHILAPVVVVVVQQHAVGGRAPTPRLAPAATAGAAQQSAWSDAVLSLALGSGRLPGDPFISCRATRTPTQCHGLPPNAAGSRKEHRRRQSRTPAVGPAARQGGPARRRLCPRSWLPRAAERDAGRCAWWPQQARATPLQGSGIGGGEWASAARCGQQPTQQPPQLAASNPAASRAGAAGCADGQPTSRRRLVSRLPRHSLQQEQPAVYVRQAPGGAAPGLGPFPASRTWPPSRCPTQIVIPL